VFGAPGFVFGRRVGSASEQLNDAKAPHEKQVWHALPPLRYPRVPERLMPIACVSLIAGCYVSTPNRNRGFVALRWKYTARVCYSY
jgi:hypothetical protein